MNMKSLEDLERAFDRGLNAWESGNVLKQANRMGQKVVRCIKRKTPVDTGNLRRRWTSDAEKQGNDIVITVSNDADYAAPVNDGHRIVSHGKTVGKQDGHHMLEKGIDEYKNTYLSEDLDTMVEALNQKMKG